MSADESWQAYIKKERSSFDVIFAKDVFSDWHEIRQPEGRAIRCLGYALELRYGHDTTGLAEKFLERSLAIVERIFAEQRFDAGFVRDTGPTKARAQALEVKALAAALLGDVLDTGLLCDAVPDLINWALHERWDDHSEDAYLRAVRLRLLAGDVESAAALFNKRRKKFKWHGEQAKVLQGTAACRTFPIDDPALFADFDAIFGRLRPRYPIGQKAYTESTLTRIELGAIRDRYFVSPNCEIDWNRTIEDMSR